MARKPTPETVVSPDPVVVGKCPSCGGEVLDGEKFYYCYGFYEGTCNFKLSKDYFRKFGRGKLRFQTMQRLLDGKRIELYSLVAPRTRKVFDCQGYLCWSEIRRWWEIKFEYDRNDQEDAPSIRKMKINIGASKLEMFDSKAD